MAKRSESLRGGELMAADKTFRGNASQFFVARELCRRGYYAVATLGNAANTDILCSNVAGTKFVHIQVKTLELRFWAFHQLISSSSQSRCRPLIGSRQLTQRVMAGPSG